MGRRGAIEDAEKDLGDQLGVVLFARDEFCKLAFRVRNGGLDGRSADQRHHWAELQAARPFALADALPRRPAKAGQETVGQVDSRIGQGRGPRSHRHAGYPRDGTGDAMDRVVEHFGRQAPGNRVRIVDLVVVVPAIDVDGKLVGPRAANQPQHVPHVEMMVDELVRRGNQAIPGSLADCRRGCRPDGSMIPVPSR